MHRRYFLLLLTLPLLLLACKSEKAELKRPGDAALKYYAYLIAGDYERYVGGMQSCDSIPDAYRKRMQVLVKQFAAEQKAENGGLKLAELVREEIAPDGRSARVFLNITFHDGTTEEVALVLIKDKDVWRMQ